MTVKNGGCTIVCSEWGWHCELAHYISRDCAVAGWDYIFIPFNLSEFVITDTELKLIANAAIIGDNNIPKNGNKTPAAIGTPNVL